MQKKILIVDDDEFYVEIIKTTVKLFLRQEVLSAGNADEAWDGIGESKPDLVIVNLDIAGKAGFELVERMQDDATAKAIPILGLSSTEENRERAEGAGCMSFLHKPFKTRELEAEMVRLLGIG